MRPSVSSIAYHDASNKDTIKTIQMQQKITVEYCQDVSVSSIAYHDQSRLSYCNNTIHFLNYLPSGNNVQIISLWEAMCKLSPLSNQHNSLHMLVSIFRNI